jgi:uncharacterized protein (DUF2336 family)
MTFKHEVIDELENALANSSASRCNDILWGVTDLFLAEPGKFSDEEIDFFDEVLRRLTLQIEITARALLASRLAVVPNAPPKTIRTLAFDDAVEVASPVLTHSGRLDDATLVENARHKGQGHLLAISQRTSLSESVTEILVERGERRVLLSTVRNPGAKFSNDGLSILVQRADDDAELTISVGGRSELPYYLFRHLLAKASREVRAKLEATYPGNIEKVSGAVTDAANVIAAQALGRPDRSVDVQSETEDKGDAPDFTDLEELAQAGRLTDFCSLLGKMCDLPLTFVEQAVVQGRSEILLVLARAAGLSWSAVKSILMLGQSKHWTSSELSKSLAGYERLRLATAQEILRFYRTRSKDGKTLQ